ncbi:LLM class flavin-dependent oxidoreductase [Methylobacterium sp. BTF04]|uniref:MupA/Atu3671 family FMN-dependent luciferase-like monooxygenase n=1 Tax=Methylobacterium sp. BTF04 TaxID=2708300 RepID=UPI0013D0AEB3|nr:MupA/Atu3671 family FMN-dependent luciferase-like monooxygenase [Methylobacterium sp. BTF04]NEU13490.1 LLM class flavin-dependent oxidoreductase [Methylobacterium sp. BTF04]
MRASPEFRCVLMGDQSLLVQCGQIALARGHRVDMVVTDNPAVAAWATGLGLPVAASAGDYAGRLADRTYDWFFSIANLRIVPRAVWGRATEGAANFHDGPLPRYAGLNTPAWAILNGETSYGITWHAMTDAVDAGAVHIARTFDLAPDETTFTLNTRCFEAGIAGFSELIDAIAEGRLQSRPQDAGSLALFGRNRRPDGAGLLRFDQPAPSLDRLARALDFGPGYANPLLTPKIRIGASTYNVATLVVSEVLTVSQPGTVLDVDTTGLTIAALDRAVRVEGLRDADGMPVSPSDLVGAGDCLPVLGPEEIDRLSAVTEAVVRHETWARARFADLSPLVLPAIRPAAAVEGALRTRSVALPAGLSGDRRIAALAAYLARVATESRFDVAYADATVGACARDYPGVFAPALPLRILAQDSTVGTDVTVGTLERSVTAALAELRVVGSHLCDLPLRWPGLTAPRYGVGLVQAAAPSRAHAIAGCPLTLVVPADGPDLLMVYASERLPEDEAEALADRMAVFLAAFPGESDRLLMDLPLMSAAMRERMLVTWNSTAVAYDETACIHTLIERQADRTPEATALVCGHRTLSFRELDERANRVAHALRARGVGPDQPVGLYVARGLDLVVGALAIQKAGGAYLPLDPNYPTDRLALMIADSGLSVVLTQRALAGAVPGDPATLLCIEDAATPEAPRTRVVSGVTAAHAAYVIYTSGSTGRPKGVVIEHRNVANFFAGMDERVARHEDPNPVWLAVTSLSFDISVLELFWTLSRGFKVVVAAPPIGAGVAAAGPMAFSLFHWGQADRADAQMYHLLLESSRFADTHGFTAVWTPERHFNDFGAPYPNPAVTGAAVAAVTRNVGIRAGSCVLPLHHPARVAEEWAVVDNLSGGRVAIAFASGWMPEDFLLRPENAPPHNKDALLRDVETVRRLWRGEAVPFAAPGGLTVDVTTQPRPVQAELPVWITTAGNPETFREAARLGANVLTHLLGQTIEELAAKIAAYREALVEAGRDPADHAVTLMLHTLLGTDRETVRTQAREPMRAYLRSAAGLIKQYAWAFPAFKRPAGITQPMAIDLRTIDPEEMDAILDFAFERYFEESGLFGTPDDAVARVAQLRAIGVDEIACLIDFGLPTATVLGALPPLASVVASCNCPAAEADEGLGAQIRRHGVTHLQCTPSMATMMLMNPEERAGLAGLRHLYVGGEALPGHLLAALLEAGIGQVTNMYGPTETTIWSSTQVAVPGPGVVPLGRPIANTQLYVLDAGLRPVPPHCPGELYIGGAGVARGYLHRPELTAERFRDNPFVPGGRIYRTGDLAQFDADGTLHFLGRIDHQVKVRGYRIALGEIEAALRACPRIREAVVTIREDHPGDQRIVAYVVADGTAPSAEEVRAELARTLPDFMVPAHVLTLDRMPLTPNAKIDRNALPPPGTVPATAPSAVAEPDGGVESAIAAVFRTVLGIDHVGAGDNFFNLGGHSLLAVQAHRTLKAGIAPQLGITDLFRFPTVRALARHLSAASGANADLAGVSDRAALRRNAMRARGNPVREVRGAG